MAHNCLLLEVKNVCIVVHGLKNRKPCIIAVLFAIKYDIINISDDVKFLL